MSGTLRPDMASRRISTISRLTLDKELPPTPEPEPEPDNSGLTTILIGPKKRRFKVNSQLLCDVSPFFQERIEDPFHSQTVSLWLPSESPAMFGLFVEWVHSPETFSVYLDDVITSAQKKGEKASLDIHWAIIHLHLFASQLSLSYLQDASIDAIQDLYLKYDWDVPPKLVAYLYTECETGPSIRLRRWAVAMVAFCLAVGGQPKFSDQDLATSYPMQFQALFQSLPEFSADYAQHMDNMKESGHDVQLKNPQLRISANKLGNNKRLFGFRECSFHSHRSTVGEGLCPHAIVRAPSRAMSAPDLPRPRWRHRRQESSNPPRSLFSRNSGRDDEEKPPSIPHSIASSIMSKFS
ncbi:hypothetical protein GGI35DRAFT_304553 [Trichoderma velutinum]